MSEENKQTYEEQLANSRNAVQRLKAHWDDLSPEEKRTAKIAGIAAVAAVPAVIGVNALASQHMDTVLDNMQNQQDPNQQHDFENGPLPPEETEGAGPMNPAPNPTEPSSIPSPEQQSVNVQLPTLPSPEEKN